ncbi:MAG: protease HtpX [Oligoflexia bacterium]|nr:protease HtpX [Oligoflexia bacterium]
MAFAKRIFFFLLVNILMVVTISIVLAILGVGPYLSSYGLDLSSLAVFCFVWGMGGAFISLAISRIMAKWMMGVKVIDPNSPGQFSDLVQTVHNLSRAAKLPALPEVGVYDSPEVNAFATGPTKSRSLVAVSTGLLRSMNKNEVEGVLAHEVAHVANGDMVTMTLIQGIINAFVMFLARIAAYAISMALANRNSDSEDRGIQSPFLFHMITFLFEIVFGILGAMVVAFFSRWREFRADAGGASLAGRENMKAALQRLLNNQDRIEDSHASLAAFKISGKRQGLAALLSTHPPLEERIRRLS